jgi:hypothetical protein
MVTAQYNNIVPPLRAVTFPFPTGGLANPPLPSSTGARLANPPPPPPSSPLLTSPQLSPRDLSSCRHLSSHRASICGGQEVRPAALLRCLSSCRPLSSHKASICGEDLRRGSFLVSSTLAAASSSRHRRSARPQPVYLCLVRRSIACAKWEPNIWR